MKRLVGLVFLIALVATAGWLTLRGRPTAQERLNAAIRTLDSGQIGPDELQQVSATIAALRRDSDTVPAADFLDAIVMLRGGRVEAALRKLSTLDQESSLRGDILLYAGEALYRLQRYSEAARALRVLVTEDPENLPARRWLSATFYDLGAFNLAIEQLNAIVRLDPSDFRPHHLLGIMYEDFEQHAEAIDHFTKSLSLGPDEATRQSILLELSRAHIAQHEYSQALTRLREASPSGAVSLLMATCTLNLGQISQAEQHLADAIAQKEESWERFALEAELAQAKGDPQRAVEILRQATDQFPHNAELRYRLALGLQATGQPAAAKEQLAVWEASRDLATRLTTLNLEAIENPYDPDVRLQLADVCEQMGKPELADMWRAAARSCQSGAALPAP